MKKLKPIEEIRKLFFDTYYSGNGDDKFKDLHDTFFRKVEDALELSYVQGTIDGVKGFNEHDSLCYQQGREEAIAECLDLIPIESYSYYVAGNPHIGKYGHWERVDDLEDVPSSYPKEHIGKHPSDEFCDYADKVKLLNQQPND